MSLRSVYRILVKGIRPCLLALVLVGASSPPSAANTITFNNKAESTYSMSIDVTTKGGIHCNTTAAIGAGMKPEQKAAAVVDAIKKNCSSITASQGDPNSPAVTVSPPPQDEITGLKLGIKDEEDQEVACAGGRQDATLLVEGTPRPDPDTLLVAVNGVSAVTLSNGRSLPTLVSELGQQLQDGGVTVTVQGSSLLVSGCDCNGITVLTQGPALTVTAGIIEALPEFPMVTWRPMVVLTLSLLVAASVAIRRRSWWAA